MEKILISACLLGDKTRYDGGDNYFPFVEKLKRYYEIIPFCPELSAGLGVPRLKAEIVRDRVKDEKGKDLTAAYNEAAEHCLRICKYFGVRIAILKDRSPACGSRQIHDGKFGSGLIEGQGITARRLIREGIKVYAETDALDFLLPSSKESKEKTGRYQVTPKKASKPAPKKDEKKAAPASKKKTEGKGKPALKKGSKKPYPKKEGKKPDSNERKDKPYKIVHSGKPAPERENSKQGEKKPYHKKRAASIGKKPANAYHKSRSYSKNKAGRATTRKKASPAKK